MARKILEALIALAVVGRAADTGPVTLVIQYKCLPGERAHVRTSMRNNGLADFARWKSGGILADYHILFSRYVDTNAWDMLELLTFPNYDAVARWRRVEESTPAGLQGDILKAAISVETYPVDLARSAAPAEAPARPVYFVIPYTYSVPTGAYLHYVDTYVRPQFEGWMREGVLAGYQLFLQRYTASRPWDTLILLEYKDDESFGQREKVVAKVRAELQSNPTWKAASDNKQNLRLEKEAVIADELTPHE
jgi:hypothetical protein